MSIKERLKAFVFGEEEIHGRVDIVTTRGRMNFSAELVNVDDYNRAIDILVEERGILFPEYEKELLKYAGNKD